MNIEQQTRALLDLVEADRARRCGQILGEASNHAAALLSQARAEGRKRLRQAFADQRQRRHERIVQAQARLATQHRLHEQQQHAAMLRLAWQQLPAVLLAQWQQPAVRAAWVARVLASARERLPPGPWRIVHAAGWPPAEQQALAAASGAAPRPALHIEADASIGAGLKVVAGGNVIDGTLDGLLADRPAIEARLLLELEAQQ